MKTVFVLVDALKSLYLNEINMPFLYALSKNGLYVKKVVPGPGFCERSEIFTGLDCFDNGYFTAVGFDREQNEYSSFIKILVFFGRLLMKINCKYGHYAFMRLFSFTKCKMKPYLIPLKMLKNFSLTEDGCTKYINHEDLFDILRKNKLSYTMRLLTSLADKKTRIKGDIIEEIRKNVKEKIDFIPAYIGEIDSAGHHYGSDEKSLRPQLRTVDQKLKQIFDICIQNDYAFVVLGDHGMVPVKKSINLKKILKSTGLKFGEDYDMFLDSTIARFWIKSKDALDIIKRTLHNLDSIGTVVDESNFQKYRIPYDIKKNGINVYGDILWLANPGILISPDFFHSEKDNIRGMHGYIKNTDESCFGQLISYYKNCNQKEIYSKPLTFVCEELASLLGVEKPNANFERMVST